MTHEVTGRHPAQALRRCATTPKESLSASLPENEKMSASQTRYFIVTPIRRSAAMTNEVTGRHPAQALRRCATTPKESLSASLPENEKMSASQTRYFIVTPIRRSAAMTHGVTGRHPAQALRRCYYAKGVSLCTRRTRGCPQRGHAFS